MHITYDPEADVLAITWREAEIVDGREVAPDLVVESDSSGLPVYVELLNASKHIDGDPLTVTLEFLAPEVAPVGGK